jgi:hypothetical protein
MHLTPSSHLLRACFGLVFSSFFLYTCQEKIEVDNTDIGFPITLDFQFDENKVSVNWVASNHSLFNNYFIVRSLTPIPAGSVPGVQQVVFSSNNRSATTFTDSLLPLAPEVYYKLYIGIGTRFLESDQIKTTFNNFTIPGSASYVQIFPDSNWLVIGDDFFQALNVVDYKKNKVLKQLTGVPVSSLESMASYIVRKPDQSVSLFWKAGNSNSATEFSLPNLQFKASNDAPYAVYSMAANPATGLLFTTESDYYGSLTSKDLYTFEDIVNDYTINSSDYYYRRNLHLLDPQNNVLVECNGYSLKKIKYQNGAFSLIEEKNVANGGYSLFPVMISSPNRSYYIPLADGNVYDQDLNKYASVPLVGNATMDLSFSKDGQFIYALYLDFNINGLRVIKYSFPEMKKVSEKMLTNINPRDIEAVDDGVLLVGFNVNFTNSILIKKLVL